MNLATFRTEISSVLGMNTLNATELALIDQWINDGVTDVVRRTKCKVVTGTMTLTSGTADYTLPDLLYLIEPYVVSGSNNFPLEHISAVEIMQLRSRNTSTTAAPSRFYAVDGANLLMLYPTPSSADVVNFLYVPRPATLSATASTPDEIPTEWHKLATFYALWHGANFDDNNANEMGDRYQGWYERGIAEMRQHLGRKGNQRLAPMRVNTRRRDQLVPHNNSQDI